MGKNVLLLANLGSPDSYQVKDVRRYLSEFLMDGRVIDIPKFARFLLVRGIIVPFRSPSSAEKYKSIWTEDGSPLIHTTRMLEKELKEHTGNPVYHCMRYGNPDPETVLRKIHEEHPDTEKVILFPLYPHYAMSSYETAVEHVKEAFRKGNFKSHLEITAPYYSDPSYIAALNESVRPYLNGNWDHIVFSYHGVPERHIVKSDCTGNHCLRSESCCSTPSAAHAFCYRHQVIETTECVVKALGIEKEKYTVSFQSRLGKDKWLSPDTASTLSRLPAEGKKRILVVCPAFVSDCLETLEEILVEGKETFMHAGGEEFTYIPCLNTRKDWVEAIRVISGLN